MNKVEMPDSQLEWHLRTAVMGIRRTLRRNNARVVNPESALIARRMLTRSSTRNTASQSTPQAGMKLLRRNLDLSSLSKYSAACIHFRYITSFRKKTLNRTIVRLKSSAFYVSFFFVVLITGRVSPCVIINRRSVRHVSFISDKCKLRDVRQKQVTTLVTFLWTQRQRKEKRNFRWRRPLCSTATIRGVSTLFRGRNSHDDYPIIIL